MKKFLFIKYLVLMTSFVCGGLLTGLAVVNWDIDFLQAKETYAQEVDIAETDINRKAQAPEGEMEKVLFSLVGDVLLASGVGDAIAAYGPDYPWRNVTEILRESDVAVANLECAISERGIPAEDKQFTFRASPLALAGVEQAGIDVLTLANNHILDFGPEAMLDTIRFIGERELKYTGAGINLAQAAAPAMLQKKGQMITVLAFSRVIPWGTWAAGEGRPGVAGGHNQKLVIERVKDAGKNADITVVCIHWGNELQDFPNQNDIDLARALVDSGADIVVGHHPHVLQGVEIYKGKVIAYSLGNFIFTTSAVPRAREGAVLQVKAGNDGSYSARIIPTYISGGTTTILTGDEKKRVLDRINYLCSPFGTVVDEEGFISLRRRSPG